MSVDSPLPKVLRAAKLQKWRYEDLSNKNNQTKPTYGYCPVSHDLMVVPQIQLCSLAAFGPSEYIGF